MQTLIAGAFKRIHAAGKGVGILTLDETMARKHIEMGANFIALGTDSNLMVKATSALLAKFRGAAAPAAPARSEEHTSELQSPDHLGPAEHVEDAVGGGQLDAGFPLVGMEVGSAGLHDGVHGGSFNSSAAWPARPAGRRP